MQRFGGTSSQRLAHNCAYGSVFLSISLLPAAPMPATAFSKGLSSLGSRLPAAGLETSLALRSPSRQLRPSLARQLIPPGLTWHYSHARLTPPQLQPGLRWAWLGALPTARGMVTGRASSATGAMALYNRLLSAYLAR